MSDRVTSSYESHIVLAYLESLMDETGKYLNGQRMTESHKEMLGRWSKWDVVSLFKVDAFLTRYELMTWELEFWADEHFGRHGFCPDGKLPTFQPTVLS